MQGLGRGREEHERVPARSRGKEASGRGEPRDGPALAGVPMRAAPPPPPLSPASLSHRPVGGRSTPPKA
jgi:hypothetical protein